jgi:hypothetical protein
MVDGATDAGLVRTGHPNSPGNETFTSTSPIEDADRGAVVMVPEERFRNRRMGELMFYYGNAIMAIVFMVIFAMVYDVFTPLQTIAYICGLTSWLIISLYIGWSWMEHDLPPRLFSKGIELMVGGYFLRQLRFVFVSFGEMEDVSYRSIFGVSYVVFRDRSDGRRYMVTERLWGPEVLKAVNVTVKRIRA